LRYRWKGPAKVSPDRRHTAHPDYVLHDDGYGRVTVRIRRRDDGEVVATSAPALAFSTSAGFARSARSLRWRSRTVVELIPYAGLSAGTAGTVVWRDNRGLVTVDLERSGTTGRPPGEPPDRPTTAEVVPRVVVQTPADAGPRIDVVGGGPMDDVPDAYVSAMCSTCWISCPGPRGRAGGRRPAFRCWRSGTTSRPMTPVRGFD
jgi:hypothetical protein